MSPVSPEMGTTSRQGIRSGTHSMIGNKLPLCGILSVLLSSNSAGLRGLLYEIEHKTIAVAG